MNLNAVEMKAFLPASDFELTKQTSASLRVVPLACWTQDAPASVVLKILPPLPTTQPVVGDTKWTPFRVTLDGSGKGTSSQWVPPSKVRRAALNARDPEAALRTASPFWRSGRIEMSWIATPEFCRIVTQS